MEKTFTEDILSIFKRLTPKNQEYLLTMIRIAETAENNLKAIFKEEK